MTDPTRTCGNCDLYVETAPGQNKTPRGGWCSAPVPSWCRVAADDARTLPTRGAMGAVRSFPLYALDVLRRVA